MKSICVRLKKEGTSVFPRRLTQVEEVEIQELMMKLADEITEDDLN